MIRSTLAVLSAPVVFGLVCLPTNWLIVKLFPSHFDENWLTKNTGLLVLLVSLTALFAAASEFVGAAIARKNITAHIIAICLLQLANGVGAQRQYWDVLPLWYHLTFFVLLLVGIPLGGWLAMKWTN